MKAERITSIDALRAITLLGILLVHTAGLFGYGHPLNADDLSFIGGDLRTLINISLANRCAKIFSILFGVSFYLILRNPQNTTRKFIWRCFLLCLMGLLNKIFYTYDALMWYGLCGIILAAFRNFSARNLLVLFLLLYASSFILSEYKLGTLFFGEVDYSRYEAASSLMNIIHYPLYRSVCDYLTVVFNGGIFNTLSYFVLGYFFAKAGIIENMKEKITGKIVCVSFCAYLALMFGYYLVKAHWMIFSGYFVGAIFYAAFIIFVYNRYSRYFHFLEPYGKLGLTNYSLQGILGVTLFSTFILPLRLNFGYAFLIALAIYVFQVVFSLLWLKKFRYGPLEWVWRCLTNLKYQSPLN